MNRYVDIGASITYIWDFPLYGNSELLNSIQSVTNAYSGTIELIHSELVEGEKVLIRVFVLSLFYFRVVISFLLY